LFIGDPLCCNQFVYFVGSDGYVNVLYWQPSFWTPDSVNFDEAGQPVPNPASGHALGRNLTNGTQSSVIYLGVDGDVHLLHTNGGYLHLDLTQAAANSPLNFGYTAPPAVGSALAGVYSKRLHYIDDAGDVHVLWNDPNYGWSHGDLHADLTFRAVPAAVTGSALSAADLTLDGQSALTEHVVYIDYEGMLYDAWRDTSDPSYQWQFNNLMYAAQATIPIPRTALATYVGPAW
jgi:hypothetical protein